MSREKRKNPPGTQNPASNQVSPPEPAWVTRVEGFRRSAGSRWLFYGVLGLLVVADVLVTHEHVLFGLAGLPGFSAVYGLISCIVIILGSKVLGHAGLMKREDYYR